MQNGTASCAYCTIYALHSLLLGSMYCVSGLNLLILLNRSYKFRGKIAHTGISTSNGHISLTVALREKLKSSDANYFHIIFWGIFGDLLTMGGKNWLPHEKWACDSNFCAPNFQEFRLKNDDEKSFFWHYGDELNGIDTWECSIWHPWTTSFSKI